jgi:gas vesicle protein
MGKSFIAFLSGLAAGIAAGILLAPDKGSVTRRNVVNNSKKWAEEGIDALKNLTNLSHNGNGHHNTEKKNKG